MADDIVYDSTGQPISAAADPSISKGGFSAFSFTTGNTPSDMLVTLSDVKVSLSDPSATTDGGSVSLTLYKDSNTSPGAEVASLGTIDDTNISNRESFLVDVPVNPDPEIFLAPDTRYWIEVSSNNSQSSLGYEANGETSGVGTQNEYYDDRDPDFTFDEVSPNSNGGAFIAQVSDDVEPVILLCFVEGTQIKTSRGNVAVEALQVGDVVVTASGSARPIRWLGHRAIDCRRHPRPVDVMPVRITAHSFAPNRPFADLLVSPGHSICVDVGGEILIPAIALVNGTTVAQVQVGRVIYWHVELDRHDILIANSLAAESYLDMGNRYFFSEGGVLALTAEPDVKGLRTHADFCRPYLATGTLVDAVRSRLATRAGALAQGAPVTSRQMA